MGPIVMKRKSTQKHKHSVRNAGEIDEKIHENDIGSACIYKRKITSHYQGGMLHFHCIYQESSSSRTNLST